MNSNSLGATKTESQIHDGAEDGNIGVVRIIFNDYHKLLVNIKVTDICNIFINLFLFRKRPKNLTQPSLA